MTQQEKDKIRVTMWTLDAINPMPISKTNDRMRQWIADGFKLGLITKDESLDMREFLLLGE